MLNQLHNAKALLRDFMKRKANWPPVAEHFFDPVSERRRFNHKKAMIPADLLKRDKHLWMEDPKSKSLNSYIRREHIFASSYFKQLSKYDARLRKEMSDRFREPTELPGEWLQDYFYYSENRPGHVFEVLCRKHKDRLNEPGEVLLDLENDPNKPDGICHLLHTRLSPDHRYLAFVIADAEEVPRLYVKDLESQSYEGPIFDANNVVWAADSRTILYTLSDDLLRPYVVLRHELYDDVENDVVVLSDDDPKMFIDINTSADGSTVLISLHSKQYNETHVLPTANPSAPPQLIQPRTIGLEYYIESWKEWYYIITNHKQQENYALMRVQKNDPRLANWETVLPSEPTTSIHDMNMYQDYLVLVERHQSLNRLRFVDLATSNTSIAKMPSEIYEIKLTNTADYGNSKIRFTYSSPLEPELTADYDMKGDHLEILQQEEVRRKYDRETLANCISERVFATAPDGVMVPVTITRHKDTPLNGKAPLLLRGYGAYGSCIPNTFVYQSLSLLQRGWILADAHVRGGGELGLQWYHNGKGLKKENSFSDFIAVTEYLHSNKYSSPHLSLAVGSSAGGLLMGVVANRRPDLFQAMVLDVPFVEVLTTSLDHTQSLTVPEYDEWGDPNDPDVFDYISGYCPYLNIKQQRYPRILAYTGMKDTRVPYYQPLKWIAKLRDTATNDPSDFMVRVSSLTGHDASYGKYANPVSEVEKFLFAQEALGLITPRATR